MDKLRRVLSGQEEDEERGLTAQVYARENLPAFTSGSTGRLTSLTAASLMFFQLTVTTINLCVKCM